MIGDDGKDNVGANHRRIYILHVPVGMEWEVGPRLYNGKVIRKWADCGRVRIGVEWSGVEVWIGLDGMESDSNGMDWIGLDCSAVNAHDGNG